MSRAKNSIATSRSENMRAIRSRGNKTTEVRIRTMFVRRALTGWKLHPIDVFGRPDFIFLKEGLCVFVDGCFWHGCPKCGHIPKTNAGYWRKKILRNRKRDALVRRKLRATGFSVLRVWECELRRSAPACLARILRSLSARRRRHARRDVAEGVA